MSMCAQKKIVATCRSTGLNKPFTQCNRKERKKNKSYCELLVWYFHNVFHTTRSLIRHETLEGLELHIVVEILGDLFV